MKRLNKKGFTIVELVIVISVIAILSAVMIPTFTGIVKKAKKSAAEQEADTALTAVLTEEDAQLDDTKTYYFISGDYWFVYNNGKLEEVKTNEIPAEKEAGANDTIYTVVKTNFAPVLDEDDSATVTELEDLGNVVVWVKAN